MTAGNDGWSMGEIRALAVKAARGAGLVWSEAEEAGFAVRWLETAGAPGCQALANFLTLKSESPASTAQCPLTLGMRILDYRTAHPIELGQVAYPLLLTPFIAAYATEPCELHWPGVTIRIADNHLHSAATRQELLQSEAVCHTANGSIQDLSFPRQTRVNPAEHPAILQLEMQAAKTYAPATEASRQKGAGSAGDDND